jgi:DNA-binding Xre family transcriptional regulator
MTKFKRKIRSRLRVMMAERDITTVTELARRLEHHGMSISSQQLSRIVKRRPVRLNTALTEALCDILDCDLSDLYFTEKVSESQTGEADSSTASAGKRPRQRSRQMPALVEPDLVGPSFGDTFKAPTRSDR